MKFRRSGMLAVHPQAFQFELGPAPLVYDAPFTVDGAAAIVCIRGMLTHHKDSPSLDCYDDIRARVRCALDSEAPSLLLNIDSLGGDVSGCFDLALWIRAEADKLGKRIMAYTDGHMASAAYALACTADLGYLGVGLTGYAGSIGVINAICDQSTLDLMQGIRFVFATSGARKGDGNPHIPVSDDTIAELQRQVDDLAQVFYTHVAARRALSVAQVAGFQAGLFFGSGAVASRLADRVCSFADMVSAAGESIPSKGAAMPKYAESMKEMLVKMAVDGDDEEKASAAKLLKALEPDKEKEGGDGEKKEESKSSSDDESKAAAAAEDEKKMAAAKAEEEKKDAESKAAAATSLSLARDLHDLKAKLAAKEDAESRAKLLATRPDFDAKTRDFLATLPVEALATACKTFPVYAAHPASAASATGTHGAGQGSSNPDADAAFIRERMYGQSSASVGFSTVKGNSVEFTPLTTEQAREVQARIAASAGKAQ